VLGEASQMGFLEWATDAYESGANEIMIGIGG
jgi:hypothetical protein